MRKLALVISIVTIAALALASVAFARPTAHASVVGGLEAAPGTWPSAAFVEAQRGDNGYSCTGTVVAPRVVLTAAHCATDPYPADYSIVTGALDVRDEAAQVSRVVQVVQFPHWFEYDLFGDAAVLILTEPTAAPAMPLATLDDIALLRAPRTVRVAGWGLMFMNQLKPPPRLRTGTLVLQSASYCGSHASEDLHHGFQPAAMLCEIDSHDYAAGPCHGDSGGPLVARRADGTDVEIGITSWGHNLCKVQYPGFFTRVDIVANWVNAWAATVASGGPGPFPAPVVPPAQTGAPPLGQLTSGEVPSDLRAQLTAKMGSRFRGAKRFKSRCARKSASSVNCKVSWVRQGKTFAGVVRVFLRYDAVTRLVVVDSRAKFQRPRGG